MGFAKHFIPFVLEYLHQNWRSLCKNGNIYISCVKAGVYDT